MYLVSLRFLRITSGASSPEWVKPTAERGGFLLCYVLFRFVCVYWLDFFVLTCLLFYVLDRKYYTLAYTNIGCLNMDHCLIINDCCLSFVLFYV
jgi:hypothetical protein